MKIRTSHYRLTPTAPSPDPEEVASRKRQEELAANIASLKAKGVQLEKERSALRGKPGYNIDWLCYQPAHAGSPELLQRSCRYLEQFRERVEAAGGKVWLCQDHDFVTRVFNITEFRTMNGGVYCSGEFTDPAYRAAYRGISPDNSTFGGDIDLLEQLAEKQPPCMNLADLPENTRIAASSDKIFGLAGACCLSFDPGYGRTGIKTFRK
jgi:hypothetical protein